MHHLNDSRYVLINCLSVPDLLLLMTRPKSIPFECCNGR